MNKRAKIIKFVSSNKKQIIFALFALLYIVDVKTNNGILRAAAPVVAAVAAEGAAAGGTAAGSAAAGSGIAAGSTAGSAAAGGETAAASSAAASSSGTVASGTTTATSSSGSTTAAANQATVQSAGNGPKPSSVGKTGNDSPMHSLNHNNDGVRKSSNSPTKNMPESEREIKKEAQEEAKKTKKENKNQRRRLPERSEREEDEKEETHETGYNMDGAYDSLTKGKPLKKLGCGIVLFFAMLLLIPTMFFSTISNTFTASTFLNFSSEESGGIIDFFATFSEKFSNALKYHYFATNKDTFNKKINDVYEKMYNNYGIPIDVPLLLSTLLTEMDSLVPEVDENNQPVINKDTMQKLEYVEDLAKMQIDEGYDIYLCSSKEVDGKSEYYNILYTGEVDDASIISGTCTASNVGKYIRSASTKIDSEKYFENLKDSVILTLLYPNYEGSKDLIVNKIKTQYDIYELMYISTYEEENNLPSELLYDSEINMQAPLRGKIYITSPFGNRGNVYNNGQIIASGGHNGIDMYAADKSIYAAGNGTVYRTYYENTGGNIVEILHTTSSGKRYITQYAHLSQILVSKDVEVKAGELIAIMGCSGSACNGTHLHFGVKSLDDNEWYNPISIVEREIN